MGKKMASISNNGDEKIVSSSKKRLHCNRRGDSIKVSRPKVYITDCSSFKSLVQELTGNGRKTTSISYSHPAPKTTSFHQPSQEEKLPGRRRGLQQELMAGSSSTSVEESFSVVVDNIAAYDSSPSMIEEGEVSLFGAHQLEYYDSAAEAEAEAEAEACFSSFTTAAQPVVVSRSHHAETASSWWMNNVVDDYGMWNEVVTMGDVEYSWPLDVDDHRFLLPMATATLC